MENSKLICLPVLLILSFSGIYVSADNDDYNSKCFSALRNYPKPDITYTAKHLWNKCPELCRNSSGRFPTGQFPHPWDCNAFINCFNDDAWVHWCQVGLVFNEKNMQCDWPRNVDCSSRHKPDHFTTAPGETTTSQWAPVTTPSTAHETYEGSITCKDSDSKLNDKEYIGIRPDLCKSGSGDYPAPDCRFYVRCIGQKAYVQRCPGGFVFEPNARRCDWPSKNPKCAKACLTDGNIQIDKQEKTTPVPKPLITTTPVPTEDPSLVNASCKEDHCIPKAGCQKELCKQPRGMFAVAGNCRKFANCWDSCAYVNECPSPMVFTEDGGMCDQPWNLPKTHKCYKAEQSDSNMEVVNSGSGYGVPYSNVIVPSLSKPGGIGFSMSQQQNGGSMIQTIS